LNVLEHANPHAYIRESHRVLRANGCFYASWNPIWSSIYGHHLMRDAAHADAGCPSYVNDGSHLPPWGATAHTLRAQTRVIIWWSVPSAH
jgi:hypothetical protein